MDSIDRDALTAIFIATNGTNWMREENWNMSADLSLWQGVKVNDQGRVVELHLSHNNLRGPIPEALKALSNLEVFLLSSNHLNGPIPEALGALSKLKMLSLNNAQLNGSIPKELGDLSELTHLGLGENQLTDSIPRELKALIKLEWLDVSKNQLSGPIPPELGHLSALQELYLTNNQLSGPIPKELGALTRMIYLSVEKNQFTGLLRPNSYGANMRDWARSPDEAEVLRVRAACSRGSGRGNRPWIVVLLDTITDIWHVVVPIVDDATDVWLLISTVDVINPLWWICVFALV
ncbi:unnamed protein product [Pylaiella littoralis]